MVLSKIFKVVSLASPTPKRKDGGGGPLFSSERTPVDLHVNQILNFIINSIQKTKKNQDGSNLQAQNRQSQLSNVDS